MRVQFREEMVCSIFQHGRDISAKQGKYVDLKLEPERVGELPEAKEWPALAEFLAQLNMTNVFRTTGCNSNDDQVPGGHAAPFVDVALDDPRLRTSEEACAQMREKLLSLDGSPTAEGLLVELVQSEATLPDDEIVPSTRIWFIGNKAQAEAAFPLIVAALESESVPTYLKRGSYDFHRLNHLFAPVAVSIDLTTLDATVSGVYVCESNDHYRTWQYLGDELCINVDLGEDIAAPQWAAHVIVGDDKAHYLGKAMNLPLYRGPMRLEKTSGGERWPNELTLDVY
jgi:hypothetical protein